jgi:hypothetical protein
MLMLSKLAKQAIPKQLSRTRDESVLALQVLQSPRAPRTTAADVYAFGIVTYEIMLVSTRVMCSVRTLIQILNYRSSPWRP